MICGNIILWQICSICRSVETKLQFPHEIVLVMFVIRQTEVARPTGMDDLLLPRFQLVIGSVY